MLSCFRKSFLSFKNYHNSKQNQKYVLITQVIRPSLADPFQQGQVSGAPVQAELKATIHTNHLNSFHQNKYFRCTLIVILLFAVLVRILQLVNIL